MDPHKRAATVEVITAEEAVLVCATTCFRSYAHPSCCIVAPSFQIFVIWRILPPSKAMS